MWVCYRPAASSVRVTKYVLLKIQNNGFMKDVHNKEMYILRAFLMNNKKYSVQSFGDMLSQKCRNMVTENLQGAGEGSLWSKEYG